MQPMAADRPANGNSTYWRWRCLFQDNSGSNPARQLSTSARIIAAVEARDRVIERQALVMSLATQVLSETATDQAVKLLVDATYTVVSCDRASLFLIEGNDLVCWATPAGGKTGWRIPLGFGVAGQVGTTGELMNISDAKDNPQLVNTMKDIDPSYTVTSVLCLPLKDAEGHVIGVLEAVNKRGTTPDGTITEEHVPFDSVDEKMLQLLLALTVSQLRVCSFIAEKEQANNKTDMILQLVEAICAQRGLDEAVAVLAKAARTLLNCEQAYVFLQEDNALACRASTCNTAESSELRFDVGDGVVGKVGASGQPVLMNQADNLEEIRALERVLPNSAEVCSVLCSPLRDSKSAQIFGAVLAINQRRTPGEQQLKDGKVRRMPAERRSLEQVLRRVSCTPGWSVQTKEPTSEMRNFEESDLEHLDALLSLVAHFIETSKLYEQQRCATRKLEALLSLLSDMRPTKQHRELNQIIALILAHSHDIFECDRCTFFTVDKFGGQLVGYFTVDGDSSGQLQELRVPMQGVAGCVASTGTLLNIRDAWSDSRFSNQVDLRTGYRTRTILCAPLTSSSGKTIAVLQCINKRRKEYFGPEEEKLLTTISALLSDLIQRTVLESSYESFIHTNESIDSDIKDMFKLYYACNKTNSDLSKDEDPVDYMMDLAGGDEMLCKVKRWDFDHMAMHDNPNRLIPYVLLCFDSLGLLAKSGIPTTALEKCVQSLRHRYSSHASYHNWAHAFATLHATFLLLNHPAFYRVLAWEDTLALLLAALGHDVEHPGYNNAFLVNTRGQLALRYNDISVLENHHASVTCNILWSSDQQLFQGLDAGLLRRMRQVIVSSILGTDMNKHHESITWLESSNIELSRFRSNEASLEADPARKLCTAMLKCADLVHPTLPWSMHKRMSLRCAQEFFEQYKEEQRLGVPSLPFMGKDPSCLSGLAPVQVGFIQFVVSPLWSAMNFAAGEDLLGSIVNNLEDNRKTWQRLSDGQEVSDDQPFQHPAGSVSSR